MLLEEIFAEVLHLSFYGTVGCGVVLICVLVNYIRAPRWISMVLWGLVALRLVIPFSVSSTISLLQFQNVANLPEQFENTLNAKGTYHEDSKATQPKSTEYEQAATTENSVMSNPKDNQTTYHYKGVNGNLKPVKTTYAQFLFVGARIWLAVMIFLWSWAVFSYARLKYHLRFSIRICNNIYETDAISSPCVVGFIKPQIYLIPGLTDQQKTHILLHEQMHIRYLDPIWKAISFLIISIHWFNPFLWFMYKIFQGELEKACDERVLSRIGEEKKADYSESLLALAASKNWRQKWNPPTPISFGENNIKSRIKQILTYKKPLVTVSVLIVILSVVGCGVFLTTPTVSTTDTPENNATTFVDSNLHSEEATQATSNTDTESDLSTDIAPENEIAVDKTAVMENTEIYEELEYNGITYQAGNNGIFRKTTNSSAAQQIYKAFAGTNLQMTVFEQKLYFKTDSTYIQGALDWADNTVRWIDLESLDTGDLPMIRENALISYFDVYDGMIQIYYSYPDAIDTIMLYAEEDTVFHDKNITQLSEAEQQQFGLRITQSILQNPCTLTNISNRIYNENIAYLDMDHDGTAEKITLTPSTSPEAALYKRTNDPLAYYHLQIGNADLEQSGDNVANILWAISLDGQNILLVLYEDGPSADPYTHFFQYQNGSLNNIGGFADDIRLCEISSDGIITGTIRKDIVQTDWITVRWQLNQGGTLEEIPQEVYDFKSGNWVQLNEELPLHTAVGATETFTIAPQNVRFLQVFADWNWVFLETTDGQQGWIHLDNFEVVELQKNVMDIFDGLYMAG